jgi:hypothetical protein
MAGSSGGGVRKAGDPPRWAATQFVHLKEIRGTPEASGSSPPRPGRRTSLTRLGACQRMIVSSCAS